MLTVAVNGHDAPSLSATPANFATATGSSVALTSPCVSQTSPVIATSTEPSPRTGNGCGEGLRRSKSVPPGTSAMYRPGSMQLVFCEPAPCGVVVKYTAPMWSVAVVSVTRNPDLRSNASGDVASSGPEAYASNVTRP